MVDPRNAKILVLNPGGTSTKIAVYEGSERALSKDIRHDAKELRAFPSVSAQLDYRLDSVRRVLDEQRVDAKGFDAVVGRGGPVAPVKSGTYAVDGAMLNAIAQGRVMVEHPSLLGAPMADRLAAQAGCPAYIVDPVSVDEFVPESRLTGLPSIERRALSHALSVKAAARAAAKELGRTFEELNMVVLHLGSGITIAASSEGRQIDATDASAAGPMSPARAGALPALDLVKMSFSGTHSQKDMERLLVKQGGWTAHLGTDDIRVIYDKIDKGDDRARLVLSATLTQIAKETAAMVSVLEGRLDAIVITGGLAQSSRFVEGLRHRINWLDAPLFVYPGEREMLALALGAIRAVTGECEALSMGPYIERFAKEQEQS